MGIVVDTSLLIASERGRFNMESLLRQHASDQWYISAITASELLVGVHRARSDLRAERTAHVESVFARFFVLAFDLEAARLHAEISAMLRVQGTPVGQHD